MKKSIATVTLSGTLQQKLEAASAAGFDGVEIFENDLTQFAGSAADVRRMANDLDLEIIALQPFRDFEAMPEPYRTQNFYRAQKKFELMHEL
ncbi:sugar phosphate isomerase/epimerase family protein, partial [Neptunomonas phycophila]